MATKGMQKGLLDKIVKVAIERLKHRSPMAMLPALQLLLTCMYTEAAGKLRQQPPDNPDSLDSEPEALVRSIERTSAILDRVQRALPMEVDALCTALARLLSDLFPTSSILTKVVGAFLSPQQPHHAYVASVIFEVNDSHGRPHEPLINRLISLQICSKSRSNESQLNLLQEWLLFSLPNFIQSLPVNMSTWFLSCLFISLSTNEWLRALYPCVCCYQNFSNVDPIFRSSTIVRFPHVQSRIGEYQAQDETILRIAALDFYRQLSNEYQRQTFAAIFENAAKQAETRFKNVLSSL